MPHGALALGFFGLSCCFSEPETFLFSASLFFLFETAALCFLFGFHAQTFRLLLGEPTRLRFSPHALLLFSLPLCGFFGLKSPAFFRLLALSFLFFLLSFSGRTPRCYYCLQLTLPLFLFFFLALLFHFGLALFLGG